MNKITNKIMTYEYLQGRTPVDLAEVVLDPSQYRMNRLSAWEMLNSRLPEFNGASWAGEPLNARLAVIRATRMVFSPTTGVACG